MQQTDEQPKKTKKTLRPETEAFLNSLTHQFLPRGHFGWEILYEKLLFLKEVHGKRHSVGLCRNCLSLISKHNKWKHESMVIRSLFIRDELLELSPDSVQEFFARHGRSKKMINGELFIGFPGYDMPCNEKFMWNADPITEGRTSSTHTQVNPSLQAENPEAQTDLRKRSTTPNKPSLSLQKTTPKPKEKSKGKTSNDNEKFVVRKRDEPIDKHSATKLTIHPASRIKLDQGKESFGKQ